MSHTITGKGNVIISDRERLYQLLDTIPDTKITYIIGYIQELMHDGVDIPNNETIDAMKEADEMIAAKTDQHFEYSAKAFINTLLEE
ncbi:MAG: hypothetical protein NC089_03610 [Bacteroides sp.]|nr:hypothetical protein [Bacteroides sp.]MCM1549745.1 hypothetical protein [Clostridium sp.]